jgi:hypothetical protein
MLQCPQCSRNSLGYNAQGQESCIYKDCRWTNKDNQNVERMNAKKYKQDRKSKKK